MEPSLREPGRSESKLAALIFHHVTRVKIRRSGQQQEQRRFGRPRPCLGGTSVTSGAPV